MCRTSSRLSQYGRAFPFDLVRRRNVGIHVVGGRPKSGATAVAWPPRARLGSRTWVGGIGVNSQSWDMEGNAESGGLHQATDKLSAKG